MAGVCSTGCGMEMFTNSPADVPKQPGCTLKGQSCQYTAQGELVCGKPMGPTPTNTGTPLFEGFFAPKAHHQARQNHQPVSRSAAQQNGHGRHEGFFAPKANPMAKKGK